MKPIVLMLCLSAIIAGCSTTRTVHKTTEITKDSTAVADRAANDQNDSFVHHIYVQDTAIGVNGWDLELNLSPDDLKPATSNGHTIDRTYTQTKGNTHATAILHKDGSMTIECKADSMTVVIQRLIRDSIYQRQRFDSFRFVKVVTAHSGDKQEEDITQKVTTVMGKIWPWLVGALCITVAIVLVDFFMAMRKRINK